MHSKGNPQEGLFGATLGFFVGFAAVALFGPTAVIFKEIMQLSPMMVGLLVAMPSLSGSLLRIPFAAWVDTTGGRKPFIILLIFSLLGMLGLFSVILMLYPDHLTSQMYPLLLLFGLFSGCGIAIFSVGISQVSYWYPQKKQGIALGTYAGVGNLAPGIFCFLLPLALMTWGLKGSYLAWLLFLVVGTALYIKMGRNAWYFQIIQSGISPEGARSLARKQGQEVFPAGSAIESLRISAKASKTWVLVGIYFTTFGGFIALTAWLPTYWKEFFGVSTLAAGILTAIYAIGASLIRIVGGRISDKFGGERTVICSLVIMLFGSSILLFSNQIAISILGEFLLACGMGMANAAVFKLVPQEIPQAVGGASGWVGGLGAFGGFAIPPMMAIFISQYGKVGYARGFIIFVFLSALSILFACLLKRKFSPTLEPKMVEAQVKELIPS